MGKTLQARAKQVARGARKKAPGAVRGSSSRAKSGKKPTLRDANRWLSQNQQQVLRKAKENCIRLTGRETL
jgi:hypothetical protein